MLKEKAKEFARLVKQVSDLNREIGETIASAIADILPDIKSSVGWAEGGVDCIAFFCDSREILSEFYNTVEEKIDLGRLLYEEITKPLGEAGAEVYFETPFGIYVTKEEAEKIRERLRALL